MIPADGDEASSGMGMLQIFYARSARAVSGSLEKEYLALMPPGIRASILRYRRWQDRQATLFGKLLLLRTLRLGFPDTGMRKFQSRDCTADGKPFIPGGPEFSISHSGEMVVLAVVQSGAVGVDIEEIRPIDTEDFSRYLPEVADLHEKDDSAFVRHLFFDCWTQKEAVLKGCGKGLLAPLEQVAIGEGTARFDQTTWFMKKLHLDHGYCCHVATDRQPGRIIVEPVDLMNGIP